MSARCQMQLDTEFHPFTPAPYCNRPAKAWIPDAYNRTGWNGRQDLCGIHRAAHDKIARRLGRPLATKILLA